LIQDTEGLKNCILVSFIPHKFSAFRTLFKLYGVTGFQQITSIEHSANTHTGREVWQMATEGVVEFMHREHVANTQPV